MADTLQLVLPPYTLLVGRRYTMNLSATRSGANQVTSSAQLEVSIPQQPLVVLVSGAGVEMGSTSKLCLDASTSYDQGTGAIDGLIFVWSCVSTHGPCRAADGSLLPAVITAQAGAPCQTDSDNCSKLRVTLQGSSEGLRYNITCTGSKDTRNSTIHLLGVTVFSNRQMPTLSIAPLPAKASPNSVTFLHGGATFTSGQAGSHWLNWEATCPDCTAQSFDLVTSSLTPLTQPTLAVQSGALEAGGAYLFVLRAGDSAGNASAALLVHVNEPPHHRNASGMAALTVFASDSAGREASASSRWVEGVPSGVALHDYFTAELLEWEDDFADLPLTYQVRYAVEGSQGGGETTALWDFVPGTAHTFQIPEPGLAQRRHHVTIEVIIRDALHATSSVTTTIRVTAKECDTDAEEAAYIDDLLQQSTFELATRGNTQRALALVNGVTSRLNAARNASVWQSQEQREQTALVLADLMDTLLLTDASVEFLAIAIASLVANPLEVTNATSAVSLSLLQDLADGALHQGSADDLALTQRAAANMCIALSSLSTVGASANGRHMPSQVAATLAVMDTIGQALGRELVEGMRSETSSDFLALSVQLDSTADLAASSLIATGPSAMSAADDAAATLTAPSSLFASLSEQGTRSVFTQMLVSTAEHHVDQSVRGAGADMLSSAVTGIVLRSQGAQEELHVSQLEAALTVTLPLDRAPLHEDAPTRARCVWWDKQTAAYSEVGCVALPNPSPPGAAIQWTQTNVSLLEGSDLHRAWDVHNVSMMSGCALEYGAVFSQYAGADAGLRKYVGADCELAHVGNAFGCWWVWQEGLFAGPGCEQQLQLQCLCTHLTDFKVSGGSDLGALNMVSGQDMTTLSLAEAGESLQVLLPTIAGLITSGLLFWLVSIAIDSVYRRHILSSLLGADASSIHFEKLTLNGHRQTKIKELFTWTMMEGGVWSAACRNTEQHSAMVGLSTTKASASSPCVNKPHQPEAPSEERSRISRLLNDVLAESSVQRAAMPHAVVTPMPGAHHAKVPKLDVRKPIVELQKAEEPLSPVVAVDPGKSRVQLKRPPRSKTRAPQATTTPPAHLSQRVELASDGQDTDAMQQAPSDNIPATGHVSCCGSDVSAPLTLPGQDAGSRTSESEPADTCFILDTRFTPRIQAPHLAIEIDPAMHHVLARAVVSPPARGPPASRAVVESVERSGGSEHKGGNSSRQRMPEDRNPLRASAAGLGSPGPTLSRAAGQVGRAVSKGSGVAGAARVTLSKSTGGTDGKSLRVSDKLGRGVRQSSEGESRDDTHGRPSHPGTLWDGWTTHRPMVPWRAAKYAIQLSNRVSTAKRSSGSIRESAWKRLSKLRELARHSLWQQPTIRGPALCKRLGINLLRLQLCVPYQDMLHASLLHCRTNPSKQEVQARKHEAKYSKLGGGGYTSLHGSPKPQFGLKVQRHWKRKSTRRRSNQGLISAEEYQLLTLDRMLGTAAITAFLSNASIISLSQLQEQLYIHEQLPWAMPLGRSYSWFHAVFMVALQQTRGKGWLERAHMLQLVFLQFPDGHFAMTQTLANLVCYGAPEVSLSVLPVPCFNLQTLHTTVPGPLHTELQSAGLGEHRASDVWASMLAIALYRFVFPAEWLDNPTDAHAQKQSLEQATQKWLDNLGAQSVGLLTLLGSLQSQADTLVQECDTKRWQLIAQLHESEWRKKRLSRRNRCTPGGVRKAVTKTAKEWCWMFMMAHPLISIGLTSCVATLSRAERIMLQVNSFIILLFLALFFTYSKAISCCRHVKDHLGCPNSADPFSVCLGYSTCSTLTTSSMGGALPKELPDWTLDDCNAFPTDDLMARLQVVTIMVMVLLPISTFFQAIFTMSTSTPVPSCWWSLPTRGKKQMHHYGPVTATVLHIAANLLYAHFETVTRFNKALALILVGVIGLLANPARHIEKAVRKLVAALKGAQAGVQSAIGALLPSRFQYLVQPSARMREVKGIVHQYVTPAVDGSVECVAYFLLVSLWAYLTWSLAAQGAALRKVMAEDLQKQVIETWILTVVMENFGYTCVQIVGMKLGALWLGARVQGAINQQFTLSSWYEEHVEKFFVQGSSVDGAGDDDEGDAEEAAEAEMDTGDDGGGADVSM